MRRSLPHEGSRRAIDRLTEAVVVSIVNMTNQEWKVLPTTISAARAKAELAECIRRAEAGEPVVITRHGKPVAALVPADRLQQIERLRAAGPDAGLAGLAGGWTGSEELVEHLREFRRSPPRPISKPRS
jgi:prevent-host-death family protein